jgi:hypothetical protein
MNQGGMTMSSTTLNAKRPVVSKRRSTVNKDRIPPKAMPRTDIKLDTSRQDAFLELPMEERERRIQSFIDHFAPAFAGYSSQDFLADRRREVERDVQ